MSVRVIRMLKKICVRCCLLSLIYLIPQFSLAQQSYSVGVVPQFESRKIHQIWTPILSELSSNSGLKFTLSGSPSITAFEKRLLAGEFDFVYMNPFHFVLANQKQGYIPLIKDTGRKLSGILVVRKDSVITSPKEVNGEEIAFPSPNALGASLQMRQELVDRFGITFTPKYVRSHDSVYLNVLLGKSVAGGGVMKTLNKQKDGIKNKLKIIHTTNKVSPHPIAAHPRVPQADIEQFKQAILSMMSTQQGTELLAKIPIKKAGTASLSDYRELNDKDLMRFYVQAP